MRRTKIICTIGPASRARATLRRLAEAGMDVARLNLSHGSPESHRENVIRIRETAEEVGRPIAVLVDLQGPKLRVGEMAGGGVVLEPGGRAVLTPHVPLGRSPEALPLQNEAVVGLVRPGDRVLLDDGLIELRVEAVDEPEIRCEVISGGLLKSNKGINLPGVAVGFPSITPKDREDLGRVLQWGVDWIALSFVRSAEDLLQLRNLIREAVPDADPPPVMAKIEKPQALERIDAIIEAADGIMVARGDLGIETHPEEVPMIQKRIIAKANRAGIPVVTATQMLESMTANPRPTRAEASDVANAILDGTDALMLSAETSVGSYPVEAVQTMDRIARDVEGHSRAVVRPAVAAEPQSRLSIAEAVARAARQAAEDLGAAAVITPTSSGYTARVMARYRPYAPIIAVTADEQVLRRLALHWGIVPLRAERSDNTDQMTARAVRAAQEHGLVHTGDVVVVTAGTAGSAPGTTDLLRVDVVT